MDAWPEPVQRVAAFLRETGAEARLEEFPAGTQTATDAAAAVGCRQEEIVKSLVFEHERGSVLALVPGDRRADPAKIAHAVGAAHARAASPARVEELTGFPAGGVAPFLPGKVDRVLIDNRLLVHDRVWVGAGSARHVAGLPPAELVRLTRGEQLDIAADPEASD
jgi:prolyl-tRNA editing enzyme YbaK/EbsC (Cys-tRNA(Pro) deacylase)